MKATRKRAFGQTHASGPSSRHLGQAHAIWAKSSSSLSGHRKRVGCGWKLEQSMLSSDRVNKEGCA